MYKEINKNQKAIQMIRPNGFHWKRADANHLTGHRSKPMVKLVDVRHSNIRVGETSGLRTAVFVGATSGLSRAALTELVAAFKSYDTIRVYIIGRQRGRPVLLPHSWMTLRRVNATAELVWIEGQISLVRRLSGYARTWRSVETMLDAVFLSAGYVPFSGRLVGAHLKLLPRVRNFKPLMGGSPS